MKIQVKTHIFLIVGLEEDLLCAEEGPKATIKVILLHPRSGIGACPQLHRISSDLMRKL